MIDGNCVICFRLTVIVADLENGMKKYLSGLENSNVKSLKEIVEWNMQHADEALPLGKLYLARLNLRGGILNSHRISKPVNP